MELRFRTERPVDYAAVETLVEAAFANAAYSDHSEHELVARLRRSSAFVPELSLVAEVGEKIVGHILLTRAQIQNEQRSFETLALAPVSVHPNWQNKGVGSGLIREAHQRAAQLGFGSVVLLGHSKYYPRFGYKPAVRYEISFPFEAPAENCMAKELSKGAFSGLSGKVVYPQEFFVEE